MLYRLVQSEWGTFVQRAAAGERVVPRFCEREVAAFLRCGILLHGFARVHCDDCGKDDVVAFSCKGRGFCPACGTARMVDTAAWLVDRVIPEVPVRQWVLSLPYRVRVLCAYDPAICAGVRRILLRAVSGLYEGRARRQGLPRPRAGAVAFVQRFDSGLRVNLHFHVLWLDGVYASEPGSGRVEFCEHGEVTDGDVAKLVSAIRGRVVRYLRRLGKWPDAGAEDGTDGDADLLLELGAAAVQGRRALGERAGERDMRVGRGSRSEPFVKRPLCADVDGFSLHAGVWVAARDRERLEKLCRYAGRPAIAESRLRLLPDGRVAYSLKKRWQDGTSHVVLTPQVLMERLCALVPRPRKHLVTYHGVLAPAAGLRPRVVPRVEAGEGGDAGCRHCGVAAAAGGAAAEPVVEPADRDAVVRAVMARRSVPHAPGVRRRGGRRRYPWAELLRRVFLVDVLVCPHCRGVRRLLAAIHDPASIERVLRALGLPTVAPALAAARSPPVQADLPW